MTEIEEFLETVVDLTCDVRGLPAPTVTWTSSDGKVWHSHNRGESLNTLGHQCFYIVFDRLWPSARSWRRRRKNKPRTASRAHWSLRSPPTPRLSVALPTRLAATAWPSTSKPVSPTRRLTAFPLRLHCLVTRVSPPPSSLPALLVYVKLPRWSEKRLRLRLVLWFLLFRNVLICVLCCCSAVFSVLPAPSVS